MNTKLSSRELEVAELLGQGYRVGAVAKLMSLSRHTVNSHVTSAHLKITDHYLLPEMASRLRTVEKGGHHPKIVLLCRYMWCSKRPEDVFRDHNNCLTPRENEQTLILASGYSTPQTAREMCISTHTVVTHVNHIYTKIQEKMVNKGIPACHGRIYLIVRYAFELNLVKTIFKD